MNRGRFQEALVYSENWVETLPKDKTAQKSIVWIKELIKAEEETVSVPLELLENMSGIMVPVMSG